MLVSCVECGHAAPYREGLRFCAACASPLPTTACTHCKRENFATDRFCGFCATPLAAAVRRPGAHQAGEAPAEAAPPPGMSGEILALAAEARARAEATMASPAPITKRHLAQDDIDALFGQDA